MEVEVEVEVEEEVGKSKVRFHELSSICYTLDFGGDVHRSAVSNRSCMDIDIEEKIED